MGWASRTESEENYLAFDEATLQFIEEIGLFFEREGVARVAGRIIGLLMLTPQPLNQEQIATILQVSRGSVSTNLQLGQTYRLIRIVPRRKAGDRRDYYEISGGSWERAFQHAAQEAQTVRDLALTGLRVVDPDNKAAQKRLREMEALYACYLEWIPTFNEIWQKRKAELNLED